MNLTVLSFVIFIALLLVVSILLFIAEWIKLKKFTNNKILNAELTGEFAKIAMKYQEYNSANKFDKTPGIKKYLKKVEHIVCHNSFDVFSIKVHVIGDKNSHVKKSDIENHNKIKNELYSKEVSEENKILFYEMNELLGRIYKYQHPFKYFIMSTKKNIALQILNLFVVICRLLLSSKHLRPVFVKFLERILNETKDTQVKNIKEDIKPENRSLMCAA